MSGANPYAFPCILTGMTCETELGVQEAEAFELKEKDWDELAN